MKRYHQWVRSTFLNALFDDRTPILVILSLSKLVESGSRVAFSALLPQLKATFSISNSLAGASLSLMTILFATTQLPGGLFADRAGERNVLVMSGIVSAMALSIIMLSEKFAIFLIGLVLLGIGTGLFGTTRITVVSDVFPKKRGTFIGLSEAFGNLGRTIVPPVIVLLSGILGWRLGIGLIIPFFAIISLGLWITVPRRTSEPFDLDLDRIRRIRNLGTGELDTKPFFISLVGMIFISLAHTGFVAFYPTFLIETKDIDGATAATIFGVFFIAGIVFQPLAGEISKKYGMKRTLIVSTGIAGAALFTLPLISDPYLLTMFTFFVGVQHGFWPIIFSYLLTLLSNEFQGTVVGLLRTVTFYVGATGPIIVGVLADRGLFDLGFFILSGFLFSSTVVLSFLTQLQSDR